jgi:hypothetical protein
MLFVQASIAAIYLTPFSLQMEIYDDNYFYFMDIFLQVFNKRVRLFSSLHMLHVHTNKSHHVHPFLYSRALLQ